MFLPSLVNDDPAPDLNVKLIQEEDLDKLSDYNRSITTFATERRQMAQHYMVDKDFGFCSVNSKGDICGYAFLEKQPIATKLNPLCEKHDAIARKLLIFIVSKLPKNESCTFIGGSRGVLPVHTHPPPNGIQFFHFHICFCQEAPVSEVGTPPQWLGAPPPPPTGNPGFATAFTCQLVNLISF